MHNIDDAYSQENLVSVDPFQYNAVLLAVARQLLPAFVNKDSVQIDDPFMGLMTDGRYMMVFIPYPDRRFYAPKVDYDLWVEFEKINPDGAKPVLRPDSYLGPDS